MARFFLLGATIWPFSHVFASLEDPGRMPTPPMGFNDWARFECSINQTLFTETADAMVSKGLLAAGYNRINVDDCWPQSTRLATGSLMWNTTLFPKGLPWLARYVKHRGFDFGIYSDAGNLTCGGYPGSLGHEQQDAATFESWGIDYLKLDGCNVHTEAGHSPENTYQKLYAGWHKILKGTQTPLVFSESAPAYFCCETDLTSWYEVMDWVPSYGELARHSYDIPTFNSTADPWPDVLANYYQELRVGREQGPGYFNDPDMLIPDEPNLTLEEKRSHFALWVSLSAPLLISSFVPGMGDDIVEYLTNQQLIAVNQDPLALQATLVSHDSAIDVLTRSLANGDRLVTVLNKSNRTAKTSVPLTRIGLPDYKGKSSLLDVRDLWTNTTFRLTASSSETTLRATVSSHGTSVFRVSVVDSASGYGTIASPSTWIPTGIIFNAHSFHCLTSKSEVLHWSTCDGSDGQVWQVGRNASFIRSLSGNDKCLVTSGSKVAVGSCSGAGWYYSRTGNVVESGTRQCLTEGEGGSVNLLTCGNLLNSQVFELPSGWQL